MELNIVNQLKLLDIEIGRKLFSIAKLNEIDQPPSPLQGKILKYIVENEGKEIYQKNLEERFNVSKATISEVLQTMENNKLIERIQNSQDARLKQIILTETSRKRFNEMEKSFRILNQELEKGLSEEEKQQFIITLNKMKNNIKNNI